MPAYAFEALSADGQTRKGTLEADSAKSARTQLRTQGLVPLSVDAVQAAPAGSAGAFFTRRVFGAQALSVWTRQLAGLVVSGLPLDAPVPEFPPTDMSHGFNRTLLAAAARENMTLRDLYNLIAAARGHWVITGSPKRIADILEEWFVTHAADGFNILPPWFPGQFDAFVDQVVPELQRRGLFRTAYEGTTLRENLGLARPPGRCSA